MRTFISFTNDENEVLRGDITVLITDPDNGSPYKRGSMDHEKYEADSASRMEDFMLQELCYQQEQLEKNQRSENFSMNLSRLIYNNRFYAVYFEKHKAKIRPDLF